MNIREDVRKQIVQELKINQLSQCPDIVIWYHFSSQNGVLYIFQQVKTLIEPYDAVLRKQGLISIFFDNERHVTHRDIKPSNLLINHSSGVKITYLLSAMLVGSMGPYDTFLGIRRL